MIDDRYLLISSIPVLKDDQGRRVVDELWKRDLAAHLDYIRELVLAAPSERGSPQGTAGQSPLDGHLRWERLTHAELHPSHSTAGALLRLPCTVLHLWRQIARAEIVHAHVAGWPIPYGWIAAPLARLHGKPLVIVVESAPWRLASGVTGDWKSRLRAAVFEGMARVCVNMATVVFFTQKQYRDSLLLPRRAARGHVVNASWVNEENILTDAVAEMAWASKCDDLAKPLRLVFAARLSAAKGVQVLLSTIERLRPQAEVVELLILGDGECLE